MTLATAPRRVLVLLIDGLGGEAVQQHRAHLPHLSALIDDGLWVQRVPPAHCATSLPGRAQLLTGQCSVHNGVYANNLWDGTGFRYASPDDLTAPTVLATAKRQGLTVASVGFGMAKPEDATYFRGPWWAGEMIQRGRDDQPIPAGESWRRCALHADPTLAALAAQQPADLLNVQDGDHAHYWLSGLTNDTTLLDQLAHLLQHAPDVALVWGEIAITDPLLHRYGANSPQGRWALATADALIGRLRAKMRGWGDDVHLVITSDHGHGATATALYPAFVLDESTVWQAEGAWLFVATPTAAVRARVRAQLRDLDARPAAPTMLPTALHDELSVFTAPPGTHFEAPPTVTTASGQPFYPSSHGFLPNTPSDDAFAVLYGPQVPRGVVAHSARGELTAAIAQLVGVDWAAMPRVDWLS